MSPTALERNPEKAGRQKLVGLVCGVSVTLIWSGWIVVSRFGVQQTLTIYDITALRFGVAAVIVLPFAIMDRSWRRRPGLMVLIAVSAGAPYALTAVAGMQYAPASHAGVFINGLLPIFAALIGWLWLGEGVGMARRVGMALIVVGAGALAVAATGGTGFQELATARRGHLFFLAAGAMLAFYMVAVRAWRISLREIIVVVPLFSALGFVPLWLAVLPSTLLEAPVGEIVLQGAYQGLLVSLAALLLMARTVQTLGATTTAVFMAGVPPLSGLLSIPVLGEVPGPLEWAGMALTAVGIALASGSIGGAMGWTFGPALRRISNR
ncbi:DMT family transporter [Fodinicurvata sp. EGI_FJ10296]|uniref:DMT family transporter n=1 Tax=Fodinicurvata sp. EGI_FJ10296 TaxID=3231908 RepID=UPI003455F034